MKVYIVVACFKNQIYFAWAYRRLSTAIKDYYALREDFTPNTKYRYKDYDVKCYAVELPKRNEGR